MAQHRLCPSQSFPLIVGNEFTAAPEMLSEFLDVGYSICGVGDHHGLTVSFFVFFQSGVWQAGQNFGFRTLGHHVYPHSRLGHFL
jgi:hypothetical protein